VKPCRRLSRLIEIPSCKPIFATIQEILWRDQRLHLDDAGFNPTVDRIEMRARQGQIAEPDMGFRQ
jgi:hypothetical protein